MQSLTSYIPMDRRQALANQQTLPEYSSGSVLFADISGFTPLTDALTKELGQTRAAEAMTQQLNHFYTALIAEVHRYRGSVIGFVGDQGGGGDWGGTPFCGWLARYSVD